MFCVFFKCIHVLGRSFTININIHNNENIKIVQTENVFVKSYKIAMYVILKMAAILNLQVLNLESLTRMYVLHGHLCLEMTK